MRVLLRVRERAGTRTLTSVEAANVLRIRHSSIVCRVGIAHPDIGFVFVGGRCPPCLVPEGRREANVASDDSPTDFGS